MLSAADWVSGQNANLELLDLQPEGMKLCAWKLFRA